MIIHERDQDIQYYISQCLSVRYRFSRQPLNHLLSNLAGVFDMVPERQLSILVSIGCIINELSHKLCISKGPVDPSKPRDNWRQLCVGIALQRCLGLTLFDVKYRMFKTLKHHRRQSGNGRRATDDGQRVTGNERRAMGDGWRATGAKQSCV